MSTTFGIKVNAINEVVEVAHRAGIGKGEVSIAILNPLLYLVKLDTPVIPLDNSAQGIETVNDIINFINKSTKFTFEVGDKVFCHFLKQHGKITFISQSTIDHPIKVKLEDGEIALYTLDGRLFTDQEPSLTVI